MKSRYLALLTGVSVLAWSVATEAELKPRYDNVRKPSVEVNLDALYHMQGTKPVAPTPVQIAPPAAQQRPAAQMPVPVARPIIAPVPAPTRVAQAPAAIARPVPTRIIPPMPQAVARPAMQNTDDALNTLLTPAPKPTVHYKQATKAAPRHLASRYGGKPIPTMPPALPYRAGNTTPPVAHGKPMMEAKRDDSSWWNDTTEFVSDMFDFSGDEQQVAATPTPNNALPPLPIAKAPAAPKTPRLVERRIEQPVERPALRKQIANAPERRIIPLAPLPVLPKQVAAAPSPAPKIVTAPQIAPAPVMAEHAPIVQPKPAGNAARYDGYELAEGLTSEPQLKFEPSIQAQAKPVPAPASPNQEMLLAEISDIPKYSQRTEPPALKPVAKKVMAKPVAKPIAKPAAAPLNIAPPPIQITKAVPAPAPVVKAPPVKMVAKEEEQPWFDGLKNELASYFDDEQQAQTQSKQLAATDAMPTAAAPKTASLPTPAPMAIAAASSHLPSLSKLNGDPKVIKEAAERKVEVLGEPKRIVIPQSKPTAVAATPAEPKIVQSKVRVKRIVPKALTKKIVPKALAKKTAPKEATLAPAASAKKAPAPVATKPATIVAKAAPKKVEKKAEPIKLAKAEVKKAPAPVKVVKAPKPAPAPAKKIAKPEPKAEPVKLAMVKKEPEIKLPAAKPKPVPAKKVVEAPKAKPKPVAKPAPAKVVAPKPAPQAPVVKAASKPALPVAAPKKVTEPVKVAIAKAEPKIAKAPAKPIKLEKAPAQKAVVLTREEAAPEPKIANIAKPATIPVTEKVMQMASLPKKSAPKKVSTKPAPPAQARIDFSGSDTELKPALKTKLNDIASNLKSSDTRRLNIRAFASAEKGQEVLARRIALARGLAVRAYLIDQGVNALRINVQSVGNKEGTKTPDQVLLEVKELGGA